MKLTADIDRALALIRQSKRIVALSGAGISTEAGIPDFRGAGGMWENAPLTEQLSASTFSHDPGRFYRASARLFSAIGKARPTMAHRLLAKLEGLEKIEAIVTQNIDGLHHAAGSRRIFELHGTCRTGRCPRCRKTFEMSEFYDQVARGDIETPLCLSCKIAIRPDIVLFEDLLPEEAWEGSVAATQACDLMLVLGSSLVVYPAAELPMIALSAGKPVVIVNLEATIYDRMATVAIHGRLGDFATAALAIFE